MRFRPMFNRIQRWSIAALAGATAYQIAGCDQEVSDILTKGFSTASIDLFTALIEAFFTGLNAADGNVSVTTQAIFEQVSAFLA
jgi:hypothetical protein